MIVVHHLDNDGGFTAGDKVTRITTYAYPTSTWATKARKSAYDVARQMLTNEFETRVGMPHEAEYDERNWKLRLEGK